jgi:hypothetical protein
MFVTLTFNLSNTAIRQERLHGKQYLVAPMAMITEGVHNGSGGALLYREAECKKAVPSWNTKPIVVYHPEINGQGVSACDPDILERQQIGIVLNTGWRDKLRAEAWIDEERAKLVDNRVLEALEENKMMEVSTGLFTDNVGEPGEWEGVPYIAEATNHQPDHLALLPDKVGACSIADGAGLLQLNETAQAHGLDMTRLFAREMDVLRRVVGNAMSHSNVYSALSRAVRERLGNDEVWIVDVYDGFFIYDPEDKKLYRLNYTSNDAGVEITGDPEEVVRVTEYRTVQGEFVGNTAQHNNKEIGMDKKELVASLIENKATQWTEEDREALMALDEKALAKMAPVKNAEEEKKTAGGSAPETPAPKGNPAEGEESSKEGEGAPAEGAGEKPVTMESYVAKAPPEFREVLTNALTNHNAAKAAVIKQIMANKNNQFTEEFLTTKGLQELQGMAALSPITTGEGESATVPMFNGQATLPGPTKNVENTEEPLVPPTMNFEEANA